jgi:hypothetical protein
MIATRFNPGLVVATPGALDLLARHNQSPITFIRRHLSGDWGVLDPEDAALNDRSVQDGGSMILSNYLVCGRDRLWIKTESDRSVTTLLLPEEY